MTRMNRRAIVAGGGAAMIAAAFDAPAMAHDGDASLGAWTPLADMPFPVQEIYPAPFRTTSATPTSMKSQTYNILVNAGGLTPGGQDNVTDAVTYYDPSGDRWRYGSALPEARHHIALVNNNGYLYGVGGFARNAGGGWQMRNNCWRIGAIDEPWDWMAPLPHPQAEAVCASLGGYIHFVGGRAPAGSRNQSWSDHIDTDEHWAYDAAANRWRTLAPLPSPRNSAAGAVVGGVLYVIGGRTVNDGNSSAVDVYDPMSDRWERASPMPQAQAGLAAAVLAGKIYVFGGEYFTPGGGGVFAEAWEYDPRKDKWRAVAAMPHPRHGLGAVTINNTIYVLGGALKAGGEGTSAVLDKFEI